MVDLDGLIAEADDHQAADLTDPDGDYCRNCADAWPCVTRRLADALEALRAADRLTVSECNQTAKNLQCGLHSASEPTEAQVEAAAKAVADALFPRWNESDRVKASRDQGSLIRKSGEAALVAAAPAETEWEYGWAGEDDASPWRLDQEFESVQEAEAFASSADRAWVRRDGGHIVRRRKAGPWLAEEGEKA